MSNLLFFVFKVKTAIDKTKKKTGGVFAKIFG